MNEFDIYNVYFVCMILWHLLTVYCFIAARRLEKRVNKKAMAMFEKAEEEYNDLISKKNIIEVCFL